MDNKLETALKRMENVMLQQLITSKIKTVKPNFTYKKIPFETTKQFKEMERFFAKDQMFETFKQVCPPQSY